MSKYKAAIVGLGQVGQGYDYENLDNSIILTHASALKYHNEFDLISAVDSNLSQCERFEKKFSKPAFLSIKEMYLKVRPEIISISVSTNFHFEVFEEIISYKPKAIILEKPVAHSEKEAAKMLKMAKDANCKVSVNYIRRFNPAIVELKKIIDHGDFGEIYKGVIWYTKGLINNGSHFIDLLIWFFGDITSIRVIKTGRKWDNIDPEPDLCICFGGTEIYMLAGREENYYMGSLNLISSDGVITYEDGHDILVQFSQDDPLYPDYKGLSKAVNIKNPSEKNIWYLYENLARHLKDGALISSNLDSATATLYSVMQIINKLKGKK